MVSGESGAGKTAFVETFVDRWARDERVLWAACDPLADAATARADSRLRRTGSAPGTQTVLAESDQPYDIFAAVFDDLRAAPSVLVIDDLHWADQGTDRHAEVRVAAHHRQTRSLVVGIVRDDEVGVSHPLRALLGDVARSTRARTLSVAAAEPARGRVPRRRERRSTAWLHRVTGGNAFFVCEMLEHQQASGPDMDLPTTVRDAVLARTSDLDAAAWDVAEPAHLFAGCDARPPAARTSE